MTDQPKERPLAKKAHEIFSREGTNYLTAEVGYFYYDYSNLAKDTEKELKNTTLQVRTLWAQSLANVIRIGSYLQHIKDDVLEYGVFTEWLKEEFEEPGFFTHYSARNFMNTYLLSLKYGGMHKLKPLSLHTLYTIARRSVPEEAQREIIGRSEKGESLTRQQIQQIISNHKGKTKKAKQKFFDTQATQAISINAENSDVNTNETSQITKSIPVISALNDDDVKQLPSEIEKLTLTNGSVIGVLTSPYHIRYAIDVAEAYDLLYYWNVVILQQKTGYPEDYIFHGTYDSLVIFYKDYINQPKQKIKDQFSSLEEARIALQGLAG